MTWYQLGRTGAKQTKWQAMPFIRQQYHIFTKELRNAPATEVRRHGFKPEEGEMFRCLDHLGVPAAANLPAKGRPRLAVTAPNARSSSRAGTMMNNQVETADEAGLTYHKVTT